MKTFMGQPIVADFNCFCTVAPDPKSRRQKEFIRGSIYSYNYQPIGVFLSGYNI